MCVFRTQASDLAMLISRMQKNADQVEKNILQAEELLAEVRGPHAPELETRIRQITQIKTCDLTTLTLAECDTGSVLNQKISAVKAELGSFLTN